MQERDHARAGAPAAPGQQLRHPTPARSQGRAGPLSRGQVTWLQAAAGNAAVAQRLTVQRDATPPTPAQAAASGDADTVSDVPAAAWSGAENVDRRNAVLAMLRKSFMFPWNDTTVATILNSYPDRESMKDQDIEVLRRAADRGSIRGGELYRYTLLANDFDLTVNERARQNVAKNLDELAEMAKKYGIGREAEGGASGVASSMDELQLAAGRVADARAVQAELRKVPVGKKPLDPQAPFLPSNDLVLFDPDAQPIALGPGGASSVIATPSAGGSGIVPWEQVKRAHDAVELQTGKLMAGNPALYVLAAAPALDQRLRTDTERLQFGRSALAGFDTLGPDQAKKELTAAHERARTALLKVQAEIGMPGEPVDRSRIDTGSMDELGMNVAHYPRFDTPFARWVTQHHLAAQVTRKERIANIIDAATAVILVGATVGTMGGAAAAAVALGGAAAVAGVASAGTRWSNADDLRTKQAAGFNPEDKLTSDAKVASAELEAVLATATSILAVVAAAKGLGALGLFRRSSVADDLVRLNTLSSRRAAEVVATSVRETGPLATAQGAGLGNDVYALHKYLVPGSPEAAEVLKVAELISHGLMPGVEGGLWRPELAGARQRATLNQLKEWDGSKRILLTHRTTNLEAVMNGTLEPMELPPNLRANPMAPNGVYFVSSLEGMNYGPYCFTIELDQIGMHTTPKPGEFVARGSFPPSVGHWFHIDDLAAARAAKK